MFSYRSRWKSPVVHYSWWQKTAVWEMPLARSRSAGACFVCIRKVKGDLEKVLFALWDSAKEVTTFMVYTLSGHWCLIGEWKVPEKWQVKINICLTLLMFLWESNASGRNFLITHGKVVILWDDGHVTNPTVVIILHYIRVSNHYVIHIICQLHFNKVRDKKKKRKGRKERGKGQKEKRERFNCDVVVLTIPLYDIDSYF